MFPPNVVVLLWELCGADRSLRLVSRDWRDRLPVPPAKPECVRLVAGGPWKCPLPVAWSRVDRVELSVPAAQLAKKKHGFRARLAAALRDVLRDVACVQSMRVHAPGSVVSTQCVSTLLRRASLTVQSVEIDALGVSFDRGLETTLTSTASGISYGCCCTVASGMHPGTMSHYSRLRDVRICIQLNEEGRAFNQLLSTGRASLRHLEALDIRWNCNMAVFDEGTTFANLPRLADLRVCFGYDWDIRRLSDGHQVVVKVPNHPVQVQVSCTIPVALNVTVFSSP
jgi:hypothetical protein